jgi:uncharacterized membrane protein YfcA
MKGPGVSARTEVEEPALLELSLTRRLFYEAMSTWWVVVFLSVFFIGVTKSGFGSGIGLLNVPLLTIAAGRIPSLGSGAALPLMLPLLVLGDLIAVWQYRKFYIWRKTPAKLEALALVGTASATVPEEDARPSTVPARTTTQIIARLLPGTLIGVILGAYLLNLFERQQKDVAAALVNMEIGFESVLLVALHWYRTSRRDAAEIFRPGLLRSSAVGAFAGVSSTLAHGAGPIIALHLLPQKLDRQLFVGTCAIYFFILNCAKLPAYWGAGLFAADNHATLLFSTRFMPIVLFGAIFGFWLNRRLSDRVFSKVVYAVTFCLGWYLLADSAAALRWAVK